MKPLELTYNYRNHIGVLKCDEVPNDSDRPAYLANFVTLDVGVHKVKFVNAGGTEKEAWAYEGGAWNRVPTRRDNLRANKLAGKAPGTKVGR